MFREGGTQLSIGLPIPNLGPAVPAGRGGLQLLLLRNSKQVREIFPNKHLIKKSEHRFWLKGYQEDSEDICPEGLKAPGYSECRDLLDHLVSIGVSNP